MEYLRLNKYDVTLKYLKNFVEIEVFPSLGIEVKKQLQQRLLLHVKYLGGFFNQQRKMYIMMDMKELMLLNIEKSSLETYYSWRN